MINNFSNLHGFTSAISKTRFTENVNAVLLCLWQKGTMNTQTTFWERIDIVLRETGLSPSRLGELAGATKQNANNWKNRHTKSIRPKEAFTLQDKLGYSARWLIDGTEPKMVKDAYLESLPNKIKNIAMMLLELDDDSISHIQASVEKDKLLKELQDERLKRQANG